MKQDLFMLVWDMDVNKGGINQVMLHRSALLSEQYNVTLITLDYKENYKAIERELLKSGRLNPKVKLLNIHDYYRDKYTDGKVTETQESYYNEQTQLLETGYQVQDNEVKNKNYARYFTNGIYAKYKKWNKHGELLHIDFFNENRCRTHREAFFPNGVLYRKTFFDLHSNKPIQDLFYTDEGKCYLNKWYNSQNGNVVRIFLINPQDDSIEMFSNNNEFSTYWMTDLSLKAPYKPIVICDGPGSTKAMLNVSSKFIYKVSAIHSNHFSNPHTYGSSLKSNHVDILKNIQNLDALVLLTEDQKEDIIKQFGDSGNIYVIPHFIEPLTTKDVKKDTKLVSILARYNPEKGIDSSINAFRKVVDRIVDAKLEIYGDGPDKERLENLIKELNLSENVFLKGYTNNVGEVFSKSLISLLTSKFEGFSLVLLESLVSKTPVISFDVLYGPKDIIIDGENGFLIPNSDINSLADKIIWMLENPNNAKEMGLSGKEYVLNKYSFKEHKKSWLDLLTSFK